MRASCILPIYWSRCGLTQPRNYIYHMRYGVFVTEPGEDESGEESEGESEGESENEDESDNDGSVPDAAAYQTPEN